MRETLTHGAAWQHLGVSFDSFNFAEWKKYIRGRKPHATNTDPTSGRRLFRPTILNNQSAILLRELGNLFLI